MRNATKAAAAKAAPATKAAKAAPTALPVLTNHWQATCQCVQAAAALQGPLSLQLATNPWRVGTPGHTFGAKVVMPLVAKGATYKGTLASLMQAAHKAGFEVGDPLRIWVKARD